MHEIFCPRFQYMNLLQFFFKEELALKVFIWERKNKDISVKTLNFARPLGSSGPGDLGDPSDPGEPGGLGGPGGPDE